MYIPRKFALTDEQTAAALAAVGVRATGQPRPIGPAGYSAAVDVRRGRPLARRPRLAGQPALARRRRRVGGDLRRTSHLHLAQLLRDEERDRQGRSHLELRDPQCLRPPRHPRRSRLGTRPGHQADRTATRPADPSRGRSPTRLQSSRSRSCAASSASSSSSPRSRARPRCRRTNPTGTGPASSPDCGSPTTPRDQLVADRVAAFDEGSTNANGRR